MEIILYIIVAAFSSLIGSFIVLYLITLFNTNPIPKVDYEELDRESKERLKKSEDIGKELDRLLEEYKK